MRAAVSVRSQPRNRSRDSPPTNGGFPPAVSLGGREHSEPTAQPDHADRTTEWPSRRPAEPPARKPPNAWDEDQPPPIRSGASSLRTPREAIGTLSSWISGETEALGGSIPPLPPRARRPIISQGLLRMLVSCGTERHWPPISEVRVGPPRDQRLPGRHRRLDLGRRHRGAPAVAADH